MTQNRKETKENKEMAQEVAGANVGELDQVSEAGAGSRIFVVSTMRMEGLGVAAPANSTIKTAEPVLSR